MSLSRLENTYSRLLFRREVLTHKVSQTGLVLMCDRGSLVDLRMQDYKSLCAAPTIYATLINIQTDRQTHRQHFDQLI